MKKGNAIKSAQPAQIRILHPDQTHQKQEALFVKEEKIEQAFQRIAESGYTRAQLFRMSVDIRLPMHEWLLISQAAMYKKESIGEVLTAVVNESQLLTEWSNGDLLPKPSQWEFEPTPEVAELIAQAGDNADEVINECIRLYFAKQKAA